MRLSYDKNKLQSAIESLLDFVETKYNYTSPRSMLNDLAKFQVFLLTTRDNKEETKTEFFEYEFSIDGLPKFDVFQFKFVFRSINGAATLKMRKLRIIAHA